MIQTRSQPNNPFEIKQQFQISAAMKRKSEQFKWIWNISSSHLLRCVNLILLIVFCSSKMHVVVCAGSCAQQYYCVIPSPPSFFPLTAALAIEPNECVVRSPKKKGVRFSHAFAFLLAMLKIFCLRTLFFLCRLLSLSPALSFITALFFYCEVVMLCNVCADSFGGCRLGRTARLLSEMDEKKLTEPGRSNNKQLEYRRWACSQKT